MPTNYDEILKDIAKIKEQRGSMYRVESKDIVPLEFLEAAVVLKAYRGYYGNNTEKKIDEYRDLINYGIFVIERLQKDAAKVVGAKTDSSTGKPVCFGEYDVSICASGVCKDRNVCRVKKCFGHFRKLDDPDCAACGRTQECYAKTQS